MMEGINNVSISRRIIVLMLVFIVLVGANVSSLFFAMHANYEANNTFEERYALSSAMYELNLAAAALTRRMRFVAMTGGEFHYNAFWAEIERDRPGQALDTFISFNAPQNEIELLEQILERRAHMNAISEEVFRLRAIGTEESFMEAIDLAHSAKFINIDILFEGKIHDLMALTDMRTQEIIDNLLRKVEIFETLMIVISVIFILVGILGLIWSNKKIKILAVIFVVIAGANIFFTISAIFSNIEIRDAYELQTTLVFTLYEMERGTETLTRTSRAFAVLGGELQYNIYWAELELDRFGIALDTFITSFAPDSEVNMLAELVRRITSLRQVETYVMQLRLAGYVDEAVALAFSGEFATLRIPINAMNQELREIVNERTQEMVNAALHSYNVFGRLLIITTLLLFIVSFSGLFMKLKQTKSIDTKPTANLYVFGRIKNLTIAARLVASFTLIILIFIVYVAIANYFNTIIDNLNRHSTDFMSVRMEILLSYHQEFTEMRRLLSESLMNPEWLEVTSISESHHRLTILAETYKNSIRADHMFPEMPYDSRIFIMNEIMTYVNTIYELYNTNFLFSDNMSFHNDVLNYVSAAEIMLQMLRRIVSMNQEIVVENIENYRIWSNNITITALITAIILALFLAYSMVRIFTLKIKAIESDAALVEQGNFEAALLNEKTDEISKIFTNLVKVFTELIDEINEVTLKHATGNTQVRINADQFHGGYQQAALVINKLMDTVNESITNLKAAEERAQIMLNGNPIACYLIDEHFTILDCNNGAIDLFGFANKDESLEKSYEIFTAKGFSKFKKHFDVALIEKYNKFEWNLEKYDGTFVPCAFTFVRFTLENKHVIAAYIQDMTVIKRMMEQQELVQIAQENSQAKSRFLASMSHEIRTPITAVLGISEIQLHNPALPLEIEEAFAKIYSSSNTLLGIVNDILDLSKIEAGKMEISTEKYEVTGLLSDVIQLNLAFLGNKQLDFVIDIDKNIPIYLTGDELRIKQVLNNLLSNAFKYTEKGYVNFKMHITNGNQANYVNLVIIIQDTGCGMSKMQLEALFDEYSRFHEKEIRFEPGTRLGMPITHSLLQLMNATISVESEVNKGTIVTVILPQQVETHEILGAETVKHLKNFNISPHFAVKRLSFSSESMPYGRVLIVDDVDANIYVAKGLMELYQLQIDTCMSGPAAIEKIKNGDAYDIIFMDQMMPEMSGIEATAIIRQMNYALPIVALTANALMGQAEEFLRNGFDGFLSKPIQSAHLNAILHKFIRDKHKTTNHAGDDTIEYRSIDDYFNEHLKNSGVYSKICKDFARNKKNIILEIINSIKENDLKTAHRLVHTLKGLAGLIGENRLSGIAEKAEAVFVEGNVPTDLIDLLSLEMERVLAKIEKRYPAEPSLQHTDKTLDKGKASEIFGRLIQLLETNNAKALEMVGELAEIPQTNDLINQIEAIDFDIALQTLATLRKTLEV